MKQKCLASIAIAVLVTWTPSSAMSASSDCKHRIIYLPQTHESVMGSSVKVNEEGLDEISRSQFKIARYIGNNPGLPVFSEQVDTDISVTMLSSSRLAPVGKEYEALYGKSIPATYEELTPTQKQKLARAGGELTQFMLRKIEKLHKVVPDAQTQDDLFRSISEGLKNQTTGTVEFGSALYQLIFDRREILALTEINKYFKANPFQRDVVLVYGSIHDFSRHPRVFPPQCILIPYEFQKDHKGALAGHPPGADPKGVKQ